MMSPSQTEMRNLTEGMREREKKKKKNLRRRSGSEEDEAILTVFFNVAVVLVLSIIDTSTRPAKLRLLMAGSLLSVLESTSAELADVPLVVTHTLFSLSTLGIYCRHFKRKSDQPEGKNPSTKERSYLNLHFQFPAFLLLFLSPFDIGQKCIKKSSPGRRSLLILFHVCPGHNHRTASRL